MKGKVFLIGAGPGDPGLLTLKGKRCLESADVVLYDRLVSPQIIALAPGKAEKIYVGKEKANHAYRQAEINNLLLDKALQGRTVARLKGGDPFVFGRGAEEAEVLRAHGIDYEIVPGVTSAIAAPAYAGIPVTYREVATGFHVVTGHEAVASPRTPWPLLAAESQTLVVLMGLSHLSAIAEKLLAWGRSPDTPVAVIRWGTTAEQETVLGTLADIAARVQERELNPPATIVIGDVVHKATVLSWFKPVSSIGT